MVSDLPSPEIVDVYRSGQPSNIAGYVGKIISQDISQKKIRRVLWIFAGRTYQNSSPISSNYRVALTLYFHLNGALVFELPYRADRAAGYGNFKTTIPARFDGPGIYPEMVVDSGFWAISTTDFQLRASPLPLTIAADRISILCHEADSSLASDELAFGFRLLSQN
jgi:hypothetical protein